jgi:hypothetical protein
MVSKRTKTLASVSVLSVALSFGWLFLWKRGVDIGNEQRRKSPTIVQQDGSVEWDGSVWAEPPRGVTILFRGGGLIFVLGLFSLALDLGSSRRNGTRPEGK